MGYIVALLIFLCGLIFRRSTIMTILMCSYMWMLVGLNVASPDYENYQYIYNNISVVGSGFEPLFRFFCVLCKEFLSLNYQEFRMLYALIMVVLIHKTVKIYTKDVNFVLSLFLLMPFLGFVSGIRSGLSLLISSYCFRYLLEYRKFATLKYIFGILIASSVHFNSIFFIIFPLCKYIKTKIFFVLLLFTPAFLIMYYDGILYNIVALFPLPPRVLDWFIIDWSLHIKTKIVFVMFIFQLSMIYLLYLAFTNFFRNRKVNKQCCIDLNIDCNAISFVDFMSTHKGYYTWLRSNCLALFLVPLYYVSVEFSRIFSGMLLVNYSILVSLFIRAHNIRIFSELIVSRDMFLVLLILLSLLFFIFYMCILFADTFLPAVLQNNIIFSNYRLIAGA